MTLFQQIQALPYPEITVDKKSSRARKKAQIKRQVRRDVIKYLNSPQKEYSRKLLQEFTYEREIPSKNQK